MLLFCFLHIRRGDITGIAFIDSTPIEVCHPCRAHAHKVFAGLVGCGKDSVGWRYGFKVHLIINDKSELLAFKLAAANIDDRKPIPDLTQDLVDKLFDDLGYILQALFEQLYERGLQLIAKSKRNMENRLVTIDEQNSAQEALSG